MAAKLVRGTVRNGVVVLAEPLAEPDGTAVFVTVPDAAGPMNAEAVERALSFIANPAIGMWADREDMADSAAWVAKLRGHDDTADAARPD